MGKKGISLSRYWDGVCDRMQGHPYYINPTLGKYKRDEFLRILNKWSTERVTTVLKTDSFEESFGSDSIIDWIMQNCENAVNVDVSSDIVRNAKKNTSNDSLRWVVTDISQLPFRRDTIDLIFSTSTYGYLDNIRGGLQEAYRVLKPNGMLIVSVNNWYNILFKPLTKLFIFLRRIPFPMSRAYKPTHFKKLLEDVGFKVDTYEPVVHILPCLNSLLGFLNKSSFSLCSIILNFIMNRLTKYSKGKSKIKYFTSWFIIFKTQKLHNRDNELGNEN